jgi:hypothetical protein
MMAFSTGNSRVGSNPVKIAVVALSRGNRVDSLADPNPVK